MRGLSRSLIENILNFDPEEVEFEVNYPESVVCKISTKNDHIAVGLAICSTSEYYWDEKKAKNLAAGRAVKALKNQENSEPIRDDYPFFPGSWTLRQIERVLAFSDITFKSLYFSKSEPCFNL